MHRCYMIMRRYYMIMHRYFMVMHRCYMIMHRYFMVMHRYFMVMHRYYMRMSVGFSLDNFISYLLNDLIDLTLRFSSNTPLSIYMCVNRQ